MRIFLLMREFIAPVLLLSASTGCMVGPDFRSPEAPDTGSYTAALMTGGTASWQGPAGAAQRFTEDQQIPDQWWELFGSPPLNKIIRTALANSPDIAAAVATLRQAQENLRARTGSGLLPSMDVKASGERQQISGAVFGEPGASVNPFTLYNASVSFSYALDLFGGTRRELEALQSQVDFERFQLEAAWLTIASNIVTAAVREASLRGEVQALREIITTQEELLGILEQQFQAGAIAITDVLAQRAELAQTRASLPPVEKELAQTRHELAVLAGMAPGRAGALPAFELPEFRLPTELPVSLPSSLVQQRPDIRAAEEQLHAASARIGVATANLLPRITIDAGYGSAATAVGDLFGNGSAVWNFGASLLQPLFRGGELTARRRAAVAAYEQAEAQYRSTVLQAFRNVADVLLALEADARRLRAQGEAEAAARESYELAQKQFRLGAISYLALLDTIRVHQQTLINLVQARAVRLADTAALFQALGGGWWNREAAGS